MLHLRQSSCIYFFSFRFYFVFILLILLACGDIELNPVPKNRCSRYNFSIYQWHLNSITAHNFAKVNLLQSYYAIYKFDMMCLSESYLDSSISSDNDNLYIKDYNLTRTDSRNAKRVGFWVHFKEPLPVRCLPITFA